MATKQRGRPRSFDRDAALEKAMHAFWEHGYEATTVADLTRAMDIGAPSLYAAFGDKKTLFDEVVRFYSAAHASFGERACAEEPTARAALARLLHEAAAAFTRPGLPHGCLVVHAAANCTTPGIEDGLRDRRQADIAAFETRIRAGIAEGELPSDTDAAALARYTGAVFQGMSQQARDGASRSDLESLADLAMAAWPAAAKADTKRQQQTSSNA
ncbi:MULTISPECIES: TetR/AcrR family transcriptional regulator [unclassified Streptomyces]|uniref:TetR/AcrR family transcriptional regulator n=1 Tax=unclassified Streptomyces TaxID=2593676 RepID=UPI002254A3B9|nr:MULTISPECIES: TetR/AcrR family transcriptional regulator [unclassified Streptomyces]MCX5439529.1 TetR/AcrR family transcriptional regulator [Streptomyces sp. NBC_00063]WUB94021.1 TetR/AcrR family transcriptional regulator [Streptomyces sp. NBC_00569]